MNGYLAICLAFFLACILVGVIGATPRKHRPTECRVMSEADRLRLYRDKLADVFDVRGHEHEMRKARGQRVKDGWLAHMRAVAARRAAEAGKPIIEYKVSRLHARRSTRA